MVQANVIFKPISSKLHTKLSRRIKCARDQNNRPIFQTTTETSTNISAKCTETSLNVLLEQLADDTRCWERKTIIYLDLPQRKWVLSHFTHCNTVYIRRMSLNISNIFMEMATQLNNNGLPKCFNQVFVVVVISAATMMKASVACINPSHMRFITYTIFPVFQFSWAFVNEFQALAITANGQKCCRRPNWK